jgi:hypothetical protein
MPDQGLIQKNTVSNIRTFINYSDLPDYLIVSDIFRYTGFPTQIRYFKICRFLEIRRWIIYNLK